MNTVDKLIHYFNPKAGLERQRARVQTNALGSFEGASRTRPALKGWFTSDADADGDINEELPDIRSRSRDLERNNAIAHGALKTKTSYVIGAGLKPEPCIDAKYLGLNLEQAEKIQEDMLRIFSSVAEDVEGDAARRKTFYQKQAELFHSSRLNGDAFLLLPYFARNDSLIETRFQSVEGDRVCNPDHKMDSKNLSGGFQLDRYGAVTQIYVLKSGADKFGTNRKWDSVPVYGDHGRRNILFLSNQNNRASQTRGIPDLAPVLEVIRQAGRYVSAELMASVIGSKFTVFVKQDAIPSKDAFGPGSNSEVEGELEEDHQDVPPVKLEDGGVAYLGENESIEIADPKHPSGSFDPFILACWRQIGGALGIPFEILIKHFTASYSASRAALLQFYHYIMVDRADFVVNICQPYYETVITEAVAKGYLNLPGYLNDALIRKAYLKCMWHGSAMGEINELMAANAAEKRLDIGISNHNIETRKITGLDWEPINQSRIIEETKIYRPPDLVSKNENQSDQKLKNPI